MGIWHSSDCSSFASYHIETRGCESHYLHQSKCQGRSLAESSSILMSKYFGLSPNLVMAFRLGRKIMTVQICRDRPPLKFKSALNNVFIPAWHSSDCTSLLMTDSTPWVQIPQPVPSYFILELMVPYQQIREYLFKVNNNRRYMG